MMALQELLNHNGWNIVTHPYKAASTQHIFKIWTTLAEDPAADQEEDVVKEVKPPPQTQQKRQRQVAISGESVKQSAVDIDYTEFPKDAE